MKTSNSPSPHASPARGSLLLPLLACALSGLAWSASPGAEPPGRPPAAGPPRASFLRPCEGSALAGGPLCGSLSVPENRQAKTGRRIDLNVMVLPALERGAEPPQPLVYLAGGPGGAATEAAPAFEMLMPELRKRLDIVLVDQRGTGRSNPLQCSWGSFEEAARAVLLVDVAPEKLDACRKAFRADPRLYTTPVAIGDLEEVREALRYDAWNLFGQSYGSRVALVYLRRHPGSVRSVILQGAAPTTLHMPTQLAEDVDSAMERLLEDCGADPACKSSYPGLAEHLRTVIDRLEESPARVDVEDPLTGEPARLRMDRDLYVGALRVLLHSSQLAAMAPLAIEGAYRGDFSPILPILTQWTVAMARSFNIGLYLSVVCTEDLPFAEGSAGPGRTEGTLTGTAMVENHRRACAGWPRGSLPAGYSSPVRSDVPALVISGQADPVTAPRWGTQVASALRNAEHLIIPRAGHLDAIGACEQRIMADFVEKGSLEELDTACASEGRPRSFAPAPPASTPTRSR